MSESSPVDPTPQANSESWNWLWFFGVLIVLTVTFVTLEIWFSMKQQLQLEHLDRARELWEEHGLQDYTMNYDVKDRERQEYTYTIIVRGGKPEEKQQYDLDLYPYKSMTDLLDKMREQLVQDRQPDQPRIFVTATFDRRDGRVIRYVRSVRSTRERVEVNVTSLKALE